MHASSYLTPLAADLPPDLHALRQRRLERRGFSAATARVVATLVYGEPANTWHLTPIALVSSEANHG